MVIICHIFPDFQRIWQTQRTDEIAKIIAQLIETTQPEHYRTNVGIGKAHGKRTSSYEWSLLM